MQTSYLFMFVGFSFSLEARTSTSIRKSNAEEIGERKLFIKKIMAMILSKSYSFPKGLYLDNFNYQE